MKQKKQSNYILVFITLILFVSIISFVFRNYNILLYKTVLFTWQQFTYIGIITYWGLSIHRRVLDKTTKKNIIIITFLMLFWMLLRIAKYRFFNTMSGIEHYLWYMYYLPMLMIPTYFFTVGLEVNNFKFKSLYRKICLFVSSVLFIIVLTNDIHGYVFEIKSNYDDYSYGIVYFVIAGYIAILLNGGVLLLSRNSGTKNRLDNFLRTISWIVILGIYTIVYCLHPYGFDIAVFIEMPDAICFILLGLIENTVSSDFILTNINYPTYFNMMSTPAVITDKEYKIVYSTSMPFKISQDILKNATDNPVILDENTICHGQSIKGANVFWLEDISFINELTNNLSDLNLELSGERELLEAENNLLEEQTKVQEQNLIYETIGALTETQNAHIQEILESVSATQDDYIEKISLACIYGAYIKRRSNLTLLSVNNEKVNISELFYSLKESCEYLKIYGVTSCVNHDVGDIMLYSKDVCNIYDYFEHLIENNLNNLRAVLINISFTDDNVSIKFNLECTTKPHIQESIKNTEFSISHTDDTYYIRLLLRRYQKCY